MPYVSCIGRWILHHFTIWEVSDVIYYWHLFDECSGLTRWFPISYPQEIYWKIIIYTWSTGLENSRNFLLHFKSLWLNYLIFIVIFNTKKLFKLLLLFQKYPHTTLLILFVAIFCFPEHIWMYMFFLKGLNSFVMIVSSCMGHWQYLGHLFPW